MYPDNEHQIIDLSQFKHAEAVVDVIYNPLTTRLCQQAEELGMKHVNGLEMLVAQAKAACEFFHDIHIEDYRIQEITTAIYKDMVNIVLIGMPSSGKSTIAQGLAKMVDKELVDLDERIVEKAGKSIPEIFAQDGEERFRELESEVCAEVAKHPHQIISCGGGIIKRRENMQALAQNGIIFHIQRAVEQLIVDESRPLSTSRERLKEMAKERMPLYRQYSHYEIDNNAALEATLRQIKECFDEITCD